MGAESKDPENVSAVKFNIKAFSRNRMERIPYISMSRGRIVGILRLVLSRTSLGLAQEDQV